MRRALFANTGTILLLLCFAAAVPAQSLSERIEYVKRHRAAAREYPADGQAEIPAVSVQQRLHMVIDSVVIDQETLRDAFDWWSRATGIQLLINWNVMELEGIYPEHRIDLNLHHVSAAQVLAILIRRAGAPNARLMSETTPWYVEVMTKAQADRRTVVRLYDVGDMLHEVPHFTDAPKLDLQNALQSGGGGSGGGGGLFSDAGSDEEPAKPKQERGEDLAQLVRDTIEPDIWQANGGEFSSIRYFNGQLIVRAPLYVHRQIGLSQSAVGVNRGPADATYGSSVRVVPRFNSGRNDQRTANAVRRRLAGKTVTAVGVESRPATNPAK
ncbi:MAG: hypothetical protein V3U29_02410 [Phycisphaeraceae bacterium]